MCIELGDTYSGSGGAGGDWIEGSGQRVYKRGDDIPDFSAMPKRQGQQWPLPKSLTLIPETFRMTLVYGVNPHTGRQTEPWRLRNVIRWVRPNPPVGALGDKFRPATSELMVFCKSAKRYFDLDAVREPYKHPNHPQVGKPHMGQKNAEKDGNWGTFPNRTEHPAGAPPLDWWNIPTAPYKGAHYAAFPKALCVKPIKAMSPQRVCVVCGEPARRIVEPTPEYEANKLPPDDPWRSGRATNDLGQSSIKVGGTTAAFATLGFTDCGHDTWRPGHVLDCFAGTGVVGAVATGLGRDATLIDLDSRNVELARDRVGPLLFEVVDEPCIL